MTASPPNAPAIQFRRLLLVPATLLALFLGALDTLAMSAVMPTIVAELGGLHLYSWVFSSYMLSRAVALPIFGKLSDLFPNRTLYAVSIGIFLAGSVLAGMADSMMFLTLARVVQGIGAGGNFALAYIVLADIAAPGRRGKMMSLASFVWGLASVLGPTFGGLLVTYVSWRWIFYVNLPLGGLSMAGILFFLYETREKRKAVVIDYAGAVLLTVTVLSLLVAFLLGGRDHPWSSPPILGLFALAAGGAVAFFGVERRAAEPILPLSFFKVQGFRAGNAAVFFSSVAIFCVATYAPLFIQGALGRNPAELGLAMVSLSLGWSTGALFTGQLAHRIGERRAVLFGAVCLAAGGVWTVNFSSEMSLALCSAALGVAGIGMGAVSIGTLLVVQNSVGDADLGTATSAHQFTRTLGGAIGVGVAGSLVTGRFVSTFHQLSDGGLSEKMPPDVADLARRGVENVFQPEIQARLSAAVQEILGQAVADSVGVAFRIALGAALVCLAFSFRLPGRSGGEEADAEGAPSES
ncbi:MAG: MFS transporter [Desulfococcaceae bacterium]